MDLVTVDASTDGLSFYLSDGGGYQLLAQPSPGPGVREALAFDLNRDGHLDLILRAQDWVRVMAGDGTGRLSEPEQFPVPGTGPLVADADGILVAGTDGLYPITSLGQGDLIPFDETCSALAPLPHGRIALGLHGKRTGVALLNADRTRGPFIPLEGLPLDLAACQMGDLEPSCLVVLLQGPSDNSPGKLVSLTPTPEGSFRAASERAVGQRPHALAVGDMDGDGLFEVAVSAQNSHHANLFSLDASNHLEQLPDLGAGRGPLDVAFIPSPVHPDRPGATLVVLCNFSNEILLIGN
jgi:hypothetical protein